MWDRASEQALFFRFYRNNKYEQTSLHILVPETWTACFIAAFSLPAPAAAAPRDYDADVRQSSTSTRADTAKPGALMVFVRGGSPFVCRNQERMRR